MSEQHAVVIGAGPAGIATAISLQDRGVRPLLVDRAGEVASSWRTRYDRLKLNTGRQFSHLPGRPYPKGTPTFPTRDQVIAHLERHTSEAGIALKLNTAVNHIEQRHGGWRLHTSDGDIDARHAVVATGMMHTPSIPVWPGEFTGEVLHSSDYRNPAAYEGRRVLVVGSGSSGMEIAHDLATGSAAKVWMAVRTPPNIMLRGGPCRLLARTNHVPSLVDPDVIDAIRDGSIEVVATVDGFDGGDVRLVDGRRLDADVVVCATGYVTGLEPMVGHLGVLDDRGKPCISGDNPAAAGLWFIG